MQVKNPPGARSPLTTGPDIEAPGKVFAQPFYLVFKKVSTQEVTWIKVETLGGLKNVTKQIAEGNLTPVNASATLDRQLWGLLAEYTGFLRSSKPAGHFNAGIQPLGSEFGSLGEDLTELFGGFDTALTGLNEIRRNVVGNLEGAEPTTEFPFACHGPQVAAGAPLVQGDFPTPEGEEVLEDLFAATDPEDLGPDALKPTDQSEPESPTDSD